MRLASVCAACAMTQILKQPQYETKIAYKAIVFISREIRIQSSSNVWCIPWKVGRFWGGTEIYYVKLILAKKPLITT